MKQTSTFLIAALVSAASPMVASGQPVLTAATSVPMPGNTVRMLSSASVTGSAAGAGGTNQHWDISTIAFNKRTDTLSFRSCAATDDCGRYSTTVLSSYTQINGLATNYYVATATVLSRRGNKDSVGGQSFHHIYTDPLDVLHFPMSYQSAFVDSFAVFDTATNGAANNYRKGVDTVQADGWGSLRTPAGTFANTLRIKEPSICRTAPATTSAIHR